MRDSEIAASIVAGDPGGLAQAYDRHATPLFAYCRSQLHDPNDAALVVRDTFRIAAARLADLREPERLRSWLYAVARMQCLHRIETGEARSAVGEAPEEPAQLHALLRAAIGGLGQSEGDAVLLTVWQGLDTGETAAVLRISRRRAHSLLTRARGQLGTSLGALLVARTGRQSCGALNALLAGWDGQFTEAVRKQVSRHIGRCTVCADRRRRELEPALLGQAPGIALTGVLAEAGRTANVPLWLRDAALSANADGAEAGAVPSYPDTFKEDGFPEPAAQPQPWARRVTLVAAIAVAAVVLTVTVIALDGGPPNGGPHGGNAAIGAQGSGGLPGASGPHQTGGTSSSGPTAGSAQAGAGPAGSAASTRSAGSARGTHRGVSVAAVATSPMPLTSVSGVPPIPGWSPSSAPSQSATIPQSAVSSPSAAPSPTPFSASSSLASSSVPPAQGTLTVSTSVVVLTLSLGDTITLTAKNGPVFWSIAEPSSLLGKLTVTPASGTLAAGQSTLVTLTVSGLASLDTQLTVSPGGQQITVLLGVGL